jgi:UPF0716 protein FxsA
MGFFILFALLAVPILEIAVFVKVGGELGLGLTIAIVILTAIAGTTLLRHQGLATLHKVQESLNAGIFPMTEVFDGICLLVAGALLLTPGFVTDSVGLLLFIPPVRRYLRVLIGRRLVAAGRLKPANDDGEMGGLGVIDGDYVDITRKDSPRDKRTGTNRP